MDALTVIFTGLIIFDGSGNVHLVKAQHHEMEVWIDRTKHAVTSSVAFSGLTPEDVSATAGFKLLDLNALFVPRPLSLDTAPGKVISFRMQGGTTSPSGSYARCTVNGRPMLSWQALQWKVTVPAGAIVRIDGQSYPVDNKTTIHVSNDYTGTDGAAHLFMYENALREKGQLTFHKPVCEEPFPPLDQKGRAGAMKNNPVTCPPVRLQ